MSDNPARSDRATVDDGVGTLREALAELEERHSFTVRINRQISFIACADGAILSMDPLWAERTGAPVAQALGRGFLAFIHPDDRDRLARAWGAATRDAGDYLQDHRVRMADGGYRWFRCRAEKFGTLDGAVVRWRGLLTDIDELFRAREAAQTSERRFRTAARATRDVIWNVDIPADTISFSDELAKRLGYGDPASLSKLSWWRGRIHPDDLEVVVQSFRSCRDGERWKCEFRLLQADGQYTPVQSRAFVERDAAGAPVSATGALSDLSEERAAQQRIERLQAEMLDISRSGTAAALAAMLAHELNQPLTSLTNYVRGARRLLRQGDPAAHERVLTAIDSAASSALDAGAIVHRMRELISRGEARLSVQNLWDAADDARSLTSLNLSGGAIRIDIAQQLRESAVIADRVQTRQVFLNLLRNAVDALADTPRAAIVITAEPAGEFVKVAIADNGQGFGANKPEALFTPFMTTKANGIGLGLAICRMIVESNGGRIWAECNASGGATFCFTLPLAEG